MRSEVDGTTTLKLTDRDGYNKGVARAGLGPDWVVRDDYTYKYSFEAPHYGMKKTWFDFIGFPTKNESMVVPNPKDIVTKALPRIPALRVDMQATYMDIMLGQWSDGSVADAAEAYSTPVFILMQAVDNMAEAKKLAKKEEKYEEKQEEREKNFILLIVSIVLLVWLLILSRHRRIAYSRSIAA